jgi:hypothetical protein
MTEFNIKYTNGNKKEELFNELYKTKNETGDFTIIDSSKKEHKVHKNILCLNPVFKVMLNNPNFTETKNNIINLSQFDTDTVKALIDILYGNNITCNENNIVQIAQILHMYNVNENFLNQIKTHIISILSKNEHKKSIDILKKCLISNFPLVLEWISDKLKSLFCDTFRQYCHNRKEFYVNECKIVSMNTELLLIILESFNTKLYDKFEDFAIICTKIFIQEDLTDIPAKMEILIKYHNRVEKK